MASTRRGVRRADRGGRGRARAGPHAGPHVRLLAAGVASRRCSTAGRSGGLHFGTSTPGEPGDPPERRQRGPRPRARTTSRSSTTGSASRRSCARSPAPRSCPASSTSRSSTSASPTGASSTWRSRGCRPRSCAGRCSSGAEKMVVYDDTSDRAGARLRLRRGHHRARDVRRVPALLPARATSSRPRIDAAEPLQLELAGLRRRDPRRARRPARTRAWAATSSGWSRPPSARWSTTPRRCGCQPKSTRSDTSPIAAAASAGCPFRRLPLQ